MIRILKPPRLRPGDTIGICAPASPPGSLSHLESGIRYLERIGFRVKLGAHMYRKRGYLAGSDLQRASDLNAMFSDRSVRAIFTVRGGYGSQRILSLLDYRTIRRNPKILVGYSDITSLHCALFAKARLITFSGPFVVEMGRSVSVDSEERFWRCLMSARPPAPIHQNRQEQFGQNSRGIQTGPILGANLTLLSTLVGTPFFPSAHNPIYFLEDIGERPYRINRMLQQLRLAGVLAHAGGVALGTFAACKPEKGKPSLSLREIFHEVFGPFDFPVVSGFHYGHVRNSLAFPIGVRARLDGTTGTMTFLESGVD